MPTPPALGRGAHDSLECRAVIGQCRTWIMPTSRSERRDVPLARERPHNRGVTMNPSITMGAAGANLRPAATLLTVGSLSKGLKTRTKQAHGWHDHQAPRTEVKS